MTERQSDYVRSDQLNDMLVPLDELPAIFKRDARTIRRWIARDSIELTDYPGGKAVRWGDILAASTNTTRHQR